MTHGVSIAHAKRIARSAPSACITSAKVDEQGRLRADIAIDVAEARLRPGKTQDVRVIAYETVGRTDDAIPQPIVTESGRKALAIPLSVRPRDGQAVVRLRVGAALPGHAGEWVDLVVERVRPSLVPLAIALGAATLSVAVVLLNGWGDPTARKGHYEGKSTAEIRADLDQDIAWYEMGISVAGHVTMPEGSTSCELRVENVESNHCDQKVRVWETGNEDDVLYESGAIAPGEYLQTVELAHPLDVGTHTLTVQFQGYERQPALISDEGRVLGHDTFGASCAAEVTVEVLPASS